MMHKFLTVIGVFIYCGSLTAKVTFPKGWQKWSKPQTPLTKVGALPGCKADISGLKLPPIYVQTVQTYCPVRPQGPGKVGILVEPSSMPAYKSRNGNFKDGARMILHLQELKLLFVTGYAKGKPEYAVFTEGGKRIVKKNGSLNTRTCVNCHTGYKSYCVNGQCGRIVK